MATLVPSYVPNMGHLIVARKVGEKIRIGNVTVIVKSIDTCPTGERQARLAIDAPRDVPVDRLEVRIRKDREHVQGASPAG